MPSRPTAMLAATAAAALVLAPSAIAHRPVFQTGVYTAKTSQHTTFKFKLVTHTASNHCGTKGGVYCFVAMSDPSTDETCADGTRYDAGLFEVPSGFMSWRGIFSYHQNSQGSSPLIDFRRARDRRQGHRLVPRSRPEVRRQRHGALRQRHRDVHGQARLRAVTPTRPRAPPRDRRS